MTKIYYRDIDEKTRLQSKYPDVDAEWLPMQQEDVDKYGGPLVCDNDEPMELCPLGERHIARLSAEHSEEE